MLTQWNEIFGQDFSRNLHSFHEFTNHLDRFLQRDGWLSDLGASEIRPQRWFRLKDQGDHFVLLANVAGLKEENLELTLNDESMTLTGHRKIHIPEGFQALRQERQEFEFSRTFEFPCRVNVEEVEATLKEGVLRVQVGKAPEAKPQRIQIQIK